MNQGEKKKMSKRKKIILAIVVATLVVAAVGTTLAYVKHSSNSVKNTFTPSEITCEIVENVSEGVKHSVTVKNTGETEAYIRVAVIANTVDEEGNILDDIDISEYLGNAGWVKPDGSLYYYYTQPVAPDSETGELLQKAIPLEGYQVTILSEAIQSEGVTSKGAKAVFDAWGVDPSTLTN